MLKRSLYVLAFIILLLATHAASVYWNWFGNHLDAGVVSTQSLPVKVVEKKQRDLKVAGAIKQILFGDMHVHTTFSKDAFIMSLPLLGGGGAHPPADACDFARYCAGLDFWGISDHAEGLTPKHWQETKQAIQQCDAVASDKLNPDMVSFLGWEWSQAGATPEQHYGHKNVFFKDLDNDKVPTRPIGSGSKGLPGAMITGINIGLSLLDFSNRQNYYDHQQFFQEYSTIPPCPADQRSDNMPNDCEEVATTPAVLNRKLDEWGFDSLIIPHGSSWGITAPIGADIALPLNSVDFNPARESLIEIFSGHGNSEQYRPWREVAFDGDNQRMCPEKTNHYLPGCRRAGELIFQRCMQASLDEEICQQRQQQAQQNYIDAGLLKGFLTVPGASYDDWGTSDQCEDCFLPAYNYIPRSSVQYALALSNFTEDANKPLRYRFGMIGSSDNHAAKTGTGYKEFDRELMSESRTPESDLLSPLVKPDRGEPTLESIAADALPSGLAMDRERYASFTLTGGLVAVHSESRQRQDIWQALKSKEVYATSGPQILLWFDLMNEESTKPMGSELVMASTPKFRVKAAGSFKQKPGCPDYITEAIGEQRIQSLCQGECFNPDRERYQISRIEIIRIRPQSYANEPIAPLIEDPWQTHQCPESNDGCEIQFEDSDFTTGQRDSLYYVRAIQEPTSMINGAPLQCQQYNTQGQCTQYNRCDVTDKNDNCLGTNEERAWSSPIFVDFLSTPSPHPEQE